mmetsp:Transcript_21230/g.59015  ORF Transcript_21230/g.59015 Transcript_21230/m.59015 type:complete len:285 (-) Transcript_21230:58-912(-)
MQSQAQTQTQSQIPPRGGPRFSGRPSFGDTPTSRTSTGLPLPPSTARALASTTPPPLWGPPIRWNTTPDSTSSWAPSPSRPGASFWSWSWWWSWPAGGAPTGPCGSTPSASRTCASNRGTTSRTNRESSTTSHSLGRRTRSRRTTGSGWRAPTTTTGPAPIRPASSVGRRRRRCRSLSRRTNRSDSTTTCRSSTTRTARNSRRGTTSRSCCNGTIRNGTIWNGTIRYGTIWNFIPFSAILFNSKCNSIPFKILFNSKCNSKCNTKQAGTQRNNMPHNTCYLYIS